MPVDMAAYMLDRYYTRKEKAIQQLGGKCVRCGSCESLHFHHIDPSTKYFSVGSMLNGVSEKRLQEELSKCEILCKPCHTKEHATTAIHGTTAKYAAGCRCDDCREANREYMRQYRNKKRITL